jgi:hypothetical protein
VNLLDRGTRACVFLRQTDRFPFGFLFKMRLSGPESSEKHGILSGPAGLLDAGLTLATGADLFVGSKASRGVIPPEGAHYETMPELSELIDLLHFRS